MLSNFVKLAQAQQPYMENWCECFISAHDSQLLFFLFLQGLEGEDDGAISMMSDNTAKLTSAVRYVYSVLPL